MKTFKPAWWLPGAHLQTLWPTVTRKELSLPLIRERLTLPDGDFIDLDSLAAPDQAPLVLLLHGLEGSVHSPYAKGVMSALSRAGLAPLFMHFRSCSGELNTKERFYHSGETEDLAYLIEELTKRFPRRRIAAVGFSLGANVLLKYLGETGERSPLLCAVGISPPFLLDRCVDRLETGFSRLYQYHLLSQLKKKMIKKSRMMQLPLNVEKIEQAKTLRDFDDAVTAKLHNFHDAKEYYDKSSCRSYLSKITKPTLLIHAKNDPFSYPDAIPNPKELPAHIELQLEKSGGHVGFVSGTLPWRASYWLEERIPAYINQQLAV